MPKLVLCLAASIGLFSAASGQINDGQSTEEQLRALRAQMNTLQQRLDNELTERDQLLANLAATEREISATAQQIDQARRSAQTLSASLQTLETQHETLSRKTTQSLTALTELLLRGFPVTQQSTLKLLLNQQSPNKAARLLRYHQILSSHSAKTVQTLTEQITELTQTQQTMEHEILALSELERSQTHALTRLEALKGTRATTLAELNARIETEQARLARLRQDEAQLAEILEVAASVVTAPPLDDEPPSLVELKGQLPMPVTGNVLKRFGQRREGETNWRGWLIGTEAEASIHAIGAGRVVYADWLRGYGLLVIVDHTEQLLSLYAHNEKLFVEVGDWVRAGAPIGTVARPGSAPLIDQPGMYFELRENGQPTNPAAWIDPSQSR